MREVYISDDIMFFGLEFELNNTKALFRKAKVLFGLHNFHQGLCDFREAARLEPNNTKIIKELAKAYSVHYQIEANHRELKDLE